MDCKMSFKQRLARKPIVKNFKFEFIQDISICIPRRYCITFTYISWHSQHSNRRSLDRSGGCPVIEWPHSRFTTSPKPFAVVWCERLAVVCEWDRRCFNSHNCRTNVRPQSSHANPHLSLEIENFWLFFILHFDDVELTCLLWAVNQLKTIDDVVVMNAHVWKTFRNVRIQWALLSYAPSVDVRVNRVANWILYHIPRTEMVVIALNH